MFVQIKYKAIIVFLFLVVLGLVTGSTASANNPELEITSSYSNLSFTTLILGGEAAYCDFTPDFVTVGAVNEEDQQFELEFTAPSPKGINGCAAGSWQVIVDISQLPPGDYDINVSAIFHGDLTNTLLTATTEGGVSCEMNCPGGCGAGVCIPFEGE